MHIEKLREQYDSFYASKEVVFGNGLPIKLVEDLEKIITTGTVLDVGGGEGRNALYLANKGYLVTVTDLSQVGLAKLKQHALAAGIEIETMVTDVTSEPIKTNYDAMIFSFILHHLPTLDCTTLLTHAKTMTNVGGAHVISTFSNHGELYERSNESNRYYPSVEALKALYSNWEIKDLFTTEIVTLARKKNGEQMRNQVVNLLAIKPEEVN